MGCFSIPKNKSKVAAASQQNKSDGSKIEQMLSSNKPVLLPDPDDLPRGQPQGQGPVPAPTGIRKGKQQQRPRRGLEKGASRVVSAKGRSPNSSRLINHHPRAFSAPVYYSSYSHVDDRPIFPLAHLSGNSSFPISAPLSSLPSQLDGASSPSPASPPTIRSHGSPLHGFGSASALLCRDSQGLDKRVARAFAAKKDAAGRGKPGRLPVPQAANAHPLPHPSDLDEAAAVAGVTSSFGAPRSVPPSPIRGKDGFLHTAGRFRAAVGGNPAEALPLPPPALPTHGRTPVRAFSYGELAHGLVPECCFGEGVFGRAYRVWVDTPGESSSSLKSEVAVVCPVVKARQQGLREWMAEVNWLARLQSPHLCKLIGYCLEDSPGLNRRLLVYEFMNNGSLDKVVKDKKGCCPLDWVARMRVALDVARGLVYLHHKAPFQVICRDLSPSSIQLDKDLRAKLSSFGLARCGPEGDQGSLMAGPYVAPESGQSGVVTIKSNAWSFGVVLLELLTGRRHMDPSFPSGQQNLIQLAKPFLKDEGKLLLIMDPDLNNRYSSRGACKVASLAFQCLVDEASLRPSLSEAVEVLRTAQVDEESSVGDLKKSRSLTQTIGSPVTYSRSASDHFVQRCINANSVTSSPASDPKQRDRDFLKFAASCAGASSPSYMESRLSQHSKTIFSDRDAQKLAVSGLQPLESRLQNLDGNHQKQRDLQKLANTNFYCETTQAKQRALQKDAGYGPVLVRPTSGDANQPNSPMSLSVRGEANFLQPASRCGIMGLNEGAEPGREPQRASLQAHPPVTSQVKETKQQSPQSLSFDTSLIPGSNDANEGREAHKLPATEAISSALPKSGDLKLQSPVGTSLPTRQPGSLLHSSAEMNQQIPNGRMLLAQQALLSSLSRNELRRSRELRQWKSGELMELRTADLRQQSGDPKQKIAEGWKSFTPQSPRRLQTTGESTQGPHSRLSGDLGYSSESRHVVSPKRVTEARKPLASLSSIQGGSELTHQGADSGESIGSTTVSGKIREQRPNGSKFEAASHRVNASLHSVDGKRDPLSSNVPIVSVSLENDRRSIETKKLEEQENQNFSSARSSASSRTSCAPALSFEPPALREEFCVW